MKTTCAASNALEADRFFTGFLAALKLSNPTKLVANRRALNKAFHAAVYSTDAAFPADKLNVDYDPLYGVSPWFERQLTRAQRDLLISFPNPSYSVVDVKLNESQAEKLLDRIGHREEFLALAKQFLENLKND
jgi:hypothetical protein